MTTLVQARHRKRNRVQLYLVVALFALPPIAAWFFFLNPQLLPQGGKNHGELIDPPVDVAAMSMQTADGVPFDWSLLKDKWTMVVVAEGRCAEQCTEQLIKVRQIRRAMGAGRQRIERLLVVLPDTSGGLELPALEGLDGTRIAVGSESDVEAHSNLFRLRQLSPEQSLYLIDPMTKMMMVYNLDQVSSKQIHQDLEHLLKASQGWAKGGQYGHK